MSRINVLRRKLNTYAEVFGEEFEKYNTAKNRFWGSISVAVFAMFIFAMSLIEPRYVKPRPYIEANRDYSRLPFDELDATNACRAESQARFGESLVRLTLDSHSTRFELSEGMYKIFMQADVGSLRNYDELDVHCFVDPNKYMVDYYRTFSKKQKSLINRALSALGSLGKNKDS